VTVTVGRLLAYMLIESDNTASDALMRAVGGPEAVRLRMRDLGIEGVDVSRYEAEIFAEARSSLPSPGEGERADLRDTATPDALVDLLAAVHRGDGMSASSRRLFLAHLAATRVGPGRIRGLLPPGTHVAHKTGTFDPATNDVGIVTLPDGSHVALAVMVEGRAGGSLAARELAIAHVARAVYDAFASPGGR
jgi:beta-lactamase class A